MPVTVMEPAARAFPRDGVTRISVLSTIPAERSASTARLQNVCTTPITNVTRNMWISEAPGQATAKRHCAQLSGNPETIIYSENACRHDLLNKFGMTELFVNRLPVLHFYITIVMLDASRLACVPLIYMPVKRSMP